MTFPHEPASEAGYNPSCLVNDGRGAWFKASWTPADYPASRVAWSCDNAQVRFLGGNTGAEACAYTYASAVDTCSRLSLQFGDCPSARPSFGVKVVAPKYLKLYVTPVYLRSGDYAGLELSDYEDLQKIYAQVGITVTIVQEVPLPCSSLNGIVANSRNLKSVLRGLSPRSDGKVVYVLPFPIAGAAGFAFEMGGRELAVGANRTSTTLAHELGHALGLADLYTDLASEKPSLGLSKRLSQPANHDCFLDLGDWNNGTGTRYYASGTEHHVLVQRHLMYGVKSQCRGDLTVAEVKALSYTNPQRSSYDEIFVVSGANAMRSNDALRNAAGE